eukprot:gene14314-22389_t
MSLLSLPKLLPNPQWSIGFLLFATACKAGPLLERLQAQNPLAAHIVYGLLWRGTPDPLPD